MVEHLALPRYAAAMSIVPVSPHPLPSPPAPVPATRLSPSYKLIDAFGDFTQSRAKAPTAEQIANARAFAEQLEVLRVVAGGRPLEIRQWAGALSVVHPEGEAHASGLAADVIAPNGITDLALAQHAHQLGFARVIKLGGNLVHVEIGEGEQQALSRVARNNCGPRAETPGTGMVTRDTPIVRLMQRVPVEATQVLVRVAGVDDVIDLRQGVPRLLNAWDAVDRLDVADDVRAALVVLTVGLGLPAADTYYAFGARWWQQEILSGARCNKRLSSTAWNHGDPAAWGRLGAWQTLRSTAMVDGFSHTLAWTTGQHTRADREVDADTGRDAGAVVGGAQGPLADINVAADYAARAVCRLMQKTATPSAVVRGFYAENGVADIEACAARGLHVVDVLQRIEAVRRAAKES